MTSQNEISTITDEQIELLSTEAGQHGDLAQVELCRRALDGDAAARQACARAIDNARANED